MPPDPPVDALAAAKRRFDRATGLIALPLTLAWIVALGRLEPEPSPLLTRAVPVLAACALVSGFAFGGLAFLLRSRWPPPLGSFTLLFANVLAAVLLTSFGLTVTLLLLGFGGPPTVTLNEVPVEHGPWSVFLLNLVGWPMAFFLDYLGTLTWIAVARSGAHVLFELPSAPRT